MSLFVEIAQGIADSGISGDVVEVGVADGKSIMVLRGIFPSSKNVFGYDTYNGTPQEDMGSDELHLESIGKQTPESTPRALVGLGIVPVVGAFPGSVRIRPDLLPASVCFANIDVDTMLGTRRALEILWPLITSGGVVAVHDFYNETCPGVPKAVRDFIFGKVRVVMSADSEYLYLWKQ